MKILKIVILLICLNFILGCRSMFYYNYSVGIENVTKDTVLIVQRFDIDEDFYPLLGGYEISVGMTIDSFRKKPFPYIDLHWGVRSNKQYWNDKYTIYHTRVDMTLPPQFTKRDGCGIDFLFYHSEVLVVYTYYYGKPTEMYPLRQTKRILPDGTPYESRDFENYMNANPNATVSDFMKYQRTKYAPKR